MTFLLVMDITCLLAVCLIFSPFSQSLRLCHLFQDGMVLQREPELATIFGFEELIPGTEAFLTCSLKGKNLPTQVGIPMKTRSGIEGDWTVELPPQEAGTLCDIQILGRFFLLSLNQVIFGDVWVCSGQSNMVLPIQSIFNHSEEIAAASAYSDIRFTRLHRVPSDVEEADVEPSPWYDTSNKGQIGSFSAVCFLYARNVYDQLGVPIGLIESAVGGTRIEAWSNKEALDACEIEDNVEPEDPKNSNTYLWNSMIAPLRKMTVKGFLWYQGEGNQGWNMDKYNCTFPTLISSWREQFSMMSNTSPDAPFGFVMLSTIMYDSAQTQYPRLRRHQTADYNFVPNAVMPNTFMATAVDTYDEENGIHPRYKQIVGERLAYSGLAVAYGLDNFPINGPTSSEITVTKTV